MILLLIKKVYFREEGVVGLLRGTLVWNPRGGGYLGTNEGYGYVSTRPGNPELFFSSYEKTEL